MRRLLAWSCLLVAGLALLGATGAVPPGAAQQQRPGIALLAELEGPIGPATNRLVEDAVAAAGARGAEVLILRIDTPGGLATSMRDIISAILASPVPVVGYVAPPGAHAASAGTYILYATTVAAMAPGTNLGAATPIQIGGGGLPNPLGRGEPGDDPGGGGPDGEEAQEDRPEQPEPASRPADAAGAKAVNDAVAYIRSLAELHGRNADWAEKAVREAASLSAERALELGVIDLIAADLDELLEKIDGRTVQVGRAEQTLATRGLAIETVEPSVMTRILGVLTNPNVAVILMMIGIYGLIFEFANPGSIGPGVVGAICLVLGLYALNQLPVDYAGLALMGLGIAFMVAEAFTPTFGVLGVGGLAAFVIGAAMLMDTDVPAYQLSWGVIATLAAVSGLLLSLALGYAWRAHRRPVRSGAQALAGGPAEVASWQDGKGYVWAGGERWRARGDPALRPGQRVRVRRQDGLTLEVSADDDAGESSN